MKKYIIASFFMIFSMSFKQQQDSTKTKQDSIRKADLAEIKNRLRNTPAKTARILFIPATYFVAIQPQ